MKGTTVNKELACIRYLMKKAEERQHLASKPPGTPKELPDDGQVHERFLMVIPPCTVRKLKSGLLRVREFLSAGMRSGAAPWADGEETTVGQP